MKRVLVIGSGGSGKTTFARRLADRLGLPLVHLDAHYWKPGWIETPNEEWDERIQRFIAEPSWVMDGNYGRTLDVRLAACDTVVFLDMPRHVCLWRIVKRRFRYWGGTRPDVAPGCPERLTWEFIVWVWTYRKRRRPEVLDRLGRLSTARSVVVSARDEVDAFLAAL